MPSPSHAPTSLSIQDLARAIDIEPPEGLDVEITGVATIEDAGPGQLTFLANDRYAVKLKESRASAVLVANDYDGEAPMPMVRCEEPRLAFAKAISAFHPEPPRKVGIHPTAIVPESCTLGADVYVGPYSVLGENVTLGDRVSIHAHSVVEDDVRLGDDCTVRNHVVIRTGITLGARVILEDGVVLGADGFGFEPTKDGRLHKVPQVGTVEIGDDVEIQANVCVDRAAMGATTVGKGTKIDNLSQIAHGCVVGEHVIICGQVGLSGSTTIEDHVMIGGQVGFSGHTTVGKGAKVVAQAGVITDLEPGKIYVGAPAQEYSTMMRALALQPKLPDMMSRLKKLERRLGKLESDEG